MKINHKKFTVIMHEMHVTVLNCSKQCDEKTHLYYFCHFICNLITRFCYFVMCLILNLILISILYIIFIYTLHLHVCFLCYINFAKVYCLSYIIIHEILFHHQSALLNLRKLSFMRNISLQSM